MNERKASCVMSAADYYGYLMSGGGGGDCNRKHLRLPIANGCHCTAQRRQKKAPHKSKGMWKEGMPTNRNHGTHTHTLAVVEKCHGFLICEVLQGNQHNSVDVKGCANIFSMCKSSFNGVTLEKHCRNIEFRVHCRLMSCHKSNKIKPYCRCAFANCG